MLNQALDALTVGLLNQASGGQYVRDMDERESRRRQAEQLAAAMSGSNVPAFIRQGNLTPEEQTQFGPEQLAKYRLADMVRAAPELAPQILQSELPMSPYQQASLDIQRGDLDIRRQQQQRIGAQEQATNAFIQQALQMLGSPEPAPFSQTPMQTPAPPMGGVDFDAPIEPMTQAPQSNPFEIFDYNGQPDSIGGAGAGDFIQGATPEEQAYLEAQRRQAPAALGLMLDPRTAPLGQAIMQQQQTREQRILDRIQQRRAPAEKFQEESAKLGAKRYDEVRNQGSAAQDALNNVEQGLAVLDSGYQGGRLAGLQAFGVEAKQEYDRLSGKKTVTPEEERFLADYTTLKQLAGENVAENVKKIFGGQLSEGERRYLADLQLSGLDSETKARARLSFVKAKAEEKLREQQLASGWVDAYGDFNATNKRGQTFDTWMTQYNKANPIFDEEYRKQAGVPDVVAQKDGAQPQYQEGMRATNPQTGEVLVFRNGQWRAQ